MTTPAVSIQALHKNFGSVQALKGIDLEIEQGEFFGLLGPNGAGKSTLINALAGLTRPTSGSLKIMGHDVITNYLEARRRLGVVPQEVVFDPFFSVREALIFQSGYFGLTKNDLWVDELLDTLRLTDKADANMRSLSGGMKRRVLIAQALVHKPLVVVLDEPTAGVDVELRKSLWRFVQSLHKSGHTIVLTTHYLEEAETLCDRIGIIDHGKLITLESKQELMSRGLGQKLTVSSNSPLPDVPTELQRKIVNASEFQLELRLRREQDSVIDILDQLRAANFQIDDIGVETDSLEDIFVQLTSEQAL
ncbi:MAG: ABC transporter ATP-binding protein [Arenicellaceae bacterium]|nr:ABC transporter ATP-binding protein [Arenicellaceae bacterium]